MHSRWTKTRWHYTVNTGLVLVLAATVVMGCSSPAAPTATPRPVKTAKPTFTPVPQVTMEQPAKEPTALPTATREPGPTSTPLPTEKAPPATEVPVNTPEPPTPTAPPKPTEGPELPPVPPAKGLRMRSPEYGMQAFLWYRPEVASRDLQVIDVAGFDWVKQGFGWRDIEPKKGVFDWSHTDWVVYTCNEVGLDLVVRVDYQPQWAGGGYPTNGPPDNYEDLGDFLYAVASRYKGRIRAYEVWNEPNLAREWGGRPPNPGEYARLLQIAYRRIKEADPDAMVISAGLSPTGTYSEIAMPDDTYLDNLYQAMQGSSQGYFDVVGVHGAGYKVAPETDPNEVASNPDLGGHRFFCFRRVEDLRAIMVKYGDSGKQIALLEFGWTSDPRPDSPYNWHAVSEEQKADYFVRAYQYAEEHWSPWIGLMSLIYISKHEWTENDEQYWWAISDPGWPEFQPRPAYEALKAMSK